VVGRQLFRYRIREGLPVIRSNRRHEPWRIQTWTPNSSDQHVCTEDFLQTLSQERNLKQSLLASFRRAPVLCQIRQRIRCARSGYGEEVCIPSPKATSSSNRDATGTISTTNSCLASHRKKPLRSCESAYLSGIVLPFPWQVFLGNQSKAFVRLSRLVFDYWLVTQTKNSKLL